MRKSIHYLSATVAFAITTFQGAGAADLHVCAKGCLYSTIQAAVNAASSGDVIQIAAGHYVGNVTIEGKALTLLGAAGGPNNVSEVVGVGLGPVFTLGLGSGDSYHLIEMHNLTITQGAHQTGTGVGAGVQVRAGAYLHLFDSILTQNTARFGGGLGVNTPGGPQSTVTRCLIDDNVAVTDNPGAPDGLGGGIEVSPNSNVAVSGSTIVRNHALDGGGIFTDRGSQLTLSQSTVNDNSVAQIHFSKAYIGGAGGGIEANSSISITNSVIANNTAEGPEGGLGGGLFLVLGGADQITSTMVAHNAAISQPNVAGSGGGIFTAAPSQADTLGLDHVYVVENTSAQNGGIGGISNEGTLVLTHTTIAENTGVNCSGGVGCPP